MMKFKKFSKKLTIFLFWLILIISFIFFAVLLHLKARGFQLNFRTWKLVKTGLISLNGSPGRAEIKVNGKPHSFAMPTKINNLPPGYYEVEISAQGFQTWQKSIYVLPEKASIYQDIVLFLSVPQEVPVPKDLTTEMVRTGFTPDPSLVVKGEEIYFEERLITRFSDSVQMAVLYPDRAHIVFQIGNEIRVIDLDGANDVLLVTLSTKELTVVAFRNNGKTMYFLDQGRVLGKTIR